MARNIPLYLEKMDRAKTLHGRAINAANLRQHTFQSTKDASDDPNNTFSLTAGELSSLADALLADQLSETQAIITVLQEAEAAIDPNQ